MPAAGNRGGPVLTSTRRITSAAAALIAAIVVAGCPRSRPAIVQYSEQEQVRDAIERFRSRTLDPAKIPPPGVDPGPLEAEVGDVRGSARLIRAEDAPWNQWGDDGRPLLFNNRSAVLFEVDVVAEGAVVWRPDRTWLEVNSDDVRVPAVDSAEHLLAELNWQALQQEKWLLEGDLVQRTRHAGPFREAFVRDGDGLQGLIPFSLPDPDAPIAALRLRVGVQVDGTPHELVWTFQ